MRSGKKWMRQAIALAMENVRSGHGGPFGAVVVKKDALIATGVNRVVLANDPTAHAEITAIRAACVTLNSFQLEGCEIYASCEPCPMCLGAIYWSRLSAYYYASSRQAAAGAGFDDAFIYEELTIPPGTRKIKGRYLRLKEACEPFAEWNKSAQKTSY